VLDRFGADGRVLAGGTLLGPSLRAHPTASALVNVKRIPSLSSIERHGSSLRIGALVTAQTLADDATVRGSAPLLSLAAASLGARQLRSVATIGGNLLSGHYAADLCVALLACAAMVRTSSLHDGAREWPVEDVLAPGFSGFGRGALVTGFDVPVSNSGCAYEKMQVRRAFEMALVCAAAAVGVEGGIATSARLALGGAARTPIRAYAAEQRLIGRPLHSTVISEAAHAAASIDADPFDDERASSAYRRHLVSVLVARALASASDRHATAAAR